MNEALAPVVAIDGPSASGKGAISQRVARVLGFHLLDSGALYRIVGLFAAERGLDLDDGRAVAELVGQLDIRFEPVAGQDAARVLVNGRNVSQDIRTESCGEKASRVAALAQVREALVGLQRGFRRQPGLVADGRDMGSVIFPDAPVKVFLTATPEERARRRHKQLKEKGIDVNLAALSAEIAERDLRDRTRAVSPLRAAPGAEVVDTTPLDIEQVVNRVLSLVSERLPGAVP